MRKITLLTAIILAMAAMAVPALRQWRTVEQPDGSRLELMLMGDENLHYYITRDHVPVVTLDGTSYCYARVQGAHLSSSGMLAHEASERTATELLTVADEASMRHVRAPRAAHAQSKPRRVGEPNSDFSGSRRAPVILVKFSDKPFSAGDEDAVAFYSDMLNKHGFNTAGAMGSVNDYFSDMSRGVFDLQFDVYGPVRVSKSATYYGGPSPLFGGFDYAGDMMTEALVQADSICDIDWTVYDWDNDGEIEEVFFLYAGYGQATGGPTGTIWPHAWTLNEAYSGGAGGHGGISRDGVYINQYACGNELYGSSGSTRMGMGVFCHEFSHCMGLPDMYDTSYGGNYGMDDWDLLDHGSYNGPNGIGECPAAWTSYERNFAGWLDYTELQPGDTITGMKALTDHNGEAYIIYNDAHPDEYYLLENRRQQSWDKYTPEQGLLIIHVDYDPLLWENNVVNTEGTFTRSDGYTANFTNDHPRMTPFHKLRSLQNDTYYDTYPIVSSKLNIDSLTDNSKPAATLYNANTDGTLLMHKPITSIAKAANGDISFVFMAGQGTPALYGDVNGDGQVDIADVNTIINVMLGKATSDTCDVTNNGQVDIADVNVIINLMLGKH